VASPQLHVQRPAISHDLRTGNSSERLGASALRPRASAGRLRFRRIGVRAMPALLLCAVAVA